MSGKQGGKLEGNATRKLLKCTSSLEAELKKLPCEKYKKSLPYIVALKNFDSVVHSCFGNERLEGWQSSIDDFTGSYKALKNKFGVQISITPKVRKQIFFFTLHCMFKVHIVMVHVKQFLDKSLDKKGKYILIKLIII